MDAKLLLVKAISGIFLESVSGEGGEAAVQLAKKLMDHIKLPDNPLDVSKERSVMSRVRTTLQWMIQVGSAKPYDRKDLLGRLRLNVGDDDRFFTVLENALAEPASAEVAQSSASRLCADLRKFMAAEDLCAILRKYSHTIAFKPDTIDDMALFKQDLVNQLEALDLAGDVKQDAAFLKTIDFNDLSSLEDAFEQLQDMYSPESIINFPWKAANRMTGEQNGGRRGEWMSIEALPGQNKSGQMLDYFVSSCIFNTPHLFDKTKKPLNIFFTIEDDPSLVLRKLYTILKQREENLPIVLAGTSMREMAEYTQRELTKNGFHIQIIHLEGGKVDAFKYIDRLRQFQKEGFEIVSCFCDYVNLLSKRGMENKIVGDETQGLHRVIRAFTAPNRIFHCTAHQLSTDAKRLSRLKPDDFIKDLPGKGYYEGCQKLDTELDYEIYVNKVVASNGVYQEVQWGKHRKLGATEEKYKYYCLKFNELPMYGIRYDFDLEEDLSFTRVGGRPMSEGGGASWHDLD